MSHDMPILTIQLRSMGETISTAFALHADEVKLKVEKATMDVIAGFDFAAEVRQIARPALQKAVEKAIERYFWGEGADILDKVISRAMAKAGEK